jgi:hypothetical protein
LSEALQRTKMWYLRVFIWFSFAVYIFTIASYMRMSTTFLIFFQKRFKLAEGERISNSPTRNC